MHVTSPLTELAALKRVQVWLALAVGMIGFGGMFAVYTYISTTMTDVAGLPRSLVPWRSWSLAPAWWSAIWLAGGWRPIGDPRALPCRWVRSASSSRCSCWHHTTLDCHVGVFGIGAAGSAVAPALQTRLMDVANDAQTLAAGAQPLGAQHRQRGRGLGRRPGDRCGFGYTAPAAAGAVLALAGLVVLTVSVALRRRALV